MNVMTSLPPADGRPPENVDHQLRAFFQSEMPSPWPPLKAPVTLAARRAEGILPTSRLALAASIAALFLGGWFVSSRLPGLPGPAGSLDNGTATVPKELRHSPLQPQPPARAPR
jgi:hypothetical protein